MYQTNIYIGFFYIKFVFNLCEKKHRKDHMHKNTDTLMNEHFKPIFVRKMSGYFETLSLRTDLSFRDFYFWML